MYGVITENGGGRWRHQMNTSESASPEPALSPGDLLPSDFCAGWRRGNVRLAPEAIELIGIVDAKGPFASFAATQKADSFSPADERL